MSFPNFYNLLANLKLSSCNGSFVPKIILVGGNLAKISSLAIDGDINGSNFALNYYGT